VYRSSPVVACRRIPLFQGRVRHGSRTFFMSATQRVCLWIAIVCAVCVSSTGRAQTPAAGQQLYLARHAGCHGTTGNGGELGPAITTRVPARTDEELINLLRQGLPMSGMPAFANLSATESRDVIAFLRTLKPQDGLGIGISRATVNLAGGGTMAG